MTNTEVKITRSEKMSKGQKIFKITNQVFHVRKFLQTTVSSTIMKLWMHQRDIH